MNNLIAEITKKIAGIESVQFASFTYLSKSAGELARYTTVLGFSYQNAVLKSQVELEVLMNENESRSVTDPAKWNVATMEAAKKIKASLAKTIEAHAKGEQNEDYTKKGQYIPIGNGLNLNTKDNTIQLFGLVQSKIVLQEGNYPIVNSSDVTIARRKLEKLLTIGKFREFALDASQVAQAKVNGSTFEIPEMKNLSV